MPAELILLPRVSFRGVEITSPRLRGLLALLAEDLGRGASTARLVEGLWPDERPDNPAKAVQVLVSRARSQLGSEAIVTTPTGYRLALAEEQVDAAALVRAAARATDALRSGDAAGALAAAEAALGEWDGTADSGTDPWSALRAARVDDHRALRRVRAQALARLGRPAEAVGPLADLIGDRPRDEELLADLLRAEAVTAGPAAALDRYERYRRDLREELGADPGPALAAVHPDLLRGGRPAVRQGVSYEPNPLLGRDGDVAAVLAALRAARVVSVVGPGGLGKTRLANAVAREADQATVHFVPLAGVDADADVPAEVESALGAGESRRGHRTDPVARVAAVLGPGPALLVLDNCEHVLAGAAALAGALVARTGEVRVLTTSRAPLGVAAETVYLLPELDLATATRLFTHRARAARPDVDLPVDAVEELCGHLDGLPLAVELAAARTRTMSVAEIAARLTDRFALLRGGSRDAPARHQTLHAVVDWSWRLLSAQEQAAMRAWSLFPGGFTAAAADVLVPAADPLLEHLVDQSLLKVVEHPTGTRFRMLETVREFSAEGREPAATDGFLAWARAFGREHGGALWDADPADALARLRAEHDNLALAVRIGLSRMDGPTVAAVASVLIGLWTVESHYSRLAALDDVVRVLSHHRPEPADVEPVRAVLTLAAASTFVLRGARATRAHAALRRLPAAPPDTPIGAIAAVLDALVVDDPAALDALTERTEPVLAAVAGVAASYVRELDGDRAGALRHARRMADRLEEGSSPWLRILAHARVGELSLQVEDGAAAAASLTVVLRLQQGLGLTADAYQTQWALLLAHLQCGDVEEAERGLDRVGSARGEDVDPLLSDPPVRGEIALLRGDVEVGLRLWREAVDRLRAARTDYGAAPLTVPPWTLENEAAAVVAHARYGGLDRVPDLVEHLERELDAVVGHPVARPPAYYLEQALTGTLLLALGMVDVASGRGATGARLIALSERLGVLRNFQPTMSSAAARTAARDADRSAYDEAVSSYADLDHAGLRAAVIAELNRRGG